MNLSTPTPAETAPLSEEDFKARLAELCAQFGLHGFSIYGRFNEPPTDRLSAFKLYLHTNADRSVAEEAGYYFTQYAERQREVEEKQRLEQSKAARRKKGPRT